MGSNNYAIAIAAIVVAGLFGYLLFTLGTGLGGHEQKDNPYAILEGALSKPGNYTTYTYEYQDSMDGYAIDTKIVSTPEMGAVKVTSPVFQKSIYRGNGNVLCIIFGKNESCSYANTTLAQNFNKLSSLFPSERAANNVKALGIYNRSGAINFTGDVVEKTVNGIPCKDITYTVDYARLTLTDLNDLGISPNDPVLLYSKNYSFDYCIDNESNVRSTALNYIYLGSPRKTQTTVLQSAWGTANASEFSHPALVNESVTADLFLSAVQAETNVLACMKNQSIADQCIRDYAVTNAVPDICTLAGTKKDICILTLAPQLMRDDLCPYVENSSLKDDCWTEMGARKKNATFCANVLNATKKDYCLSLINPTTPANSTNPTNATNTANSTNSTLG